MKVVVAATSLLTLFVTGCDDPNHDNNNGIDTDHQVDDSRGNDLKDDPNEPEQTPSQDQP
ncbi:hypothetical protein DXT87_15060 [Arthrobacter sp. AET 35A]|nr:hypothetical protein [Arthrobacter sp. AET 35A]